jgi:CheY-like chemotaxis protein
MKDLQRIRPIRGIAVSGFGMEGDVEKSKAAGFFAHLLKPVNFRELQAAIERAIASA